MKFLNELYSTILLLQNLTFYLEQLLQHQQFRTVIIYHENRTAVVASTVLEMMEEMGRAGDRYFTCILYNLNVAIALSNDQSEQIGNDLLTITVLHSAVEVDHMDRFYDHFQMDPRFKHIFISTIGAKDMEIVEFFRRIWQRYILNAALIFWSDGVQIYTHLPYERNFLIKVFDEHELTMGNGVMGTKLPANISDRLFEHKDDNLGNTSFKLLLKADVLKVITVPGRFRIGSKYYYFGRDGIIARVMEKYLNANWQYQATQYLFPILKFPYINANNSIVPRDLDGNIVPADDAVKPNVNLLNFTVTSSIS